nr:MAG TPA: hypothetical protein [Bacteriophage sp.]
MNACVLNIKTTQQTLLIVTITIPSHNIVKSIKI